MEWTRPDSEAEIFNRGNLTLTNAAVDGNRTLMGSNGGGIYNNGGTVTIENSTISNNIGDTGGGGIINFFGGTLTITNSTISGNTATTGGPTAGGGGIVNLNIATVTNSTIANNNSPAAPGGGVVNAAGTFTSRNSIYGDNTASSNPDFSGTLSSLGYNLVENISGTTIIGTMTGNITGADPMLEVLADQGGTTKTHKLKIGSPAIDAADPMNFPATDQRGVMRPIDGDNSGGAQPDIGSFEATAPSAANVSISGRILSPFGRGVPQAIVYMTKQNGEILTARTNPFGYYRFIDVEVGQTLIFNVFSKRFQFSPQVVEITEDRNDLNFTAQF